MVLGAGDLLLWVRLEAYTVSVARALGYPEGEEQPVRESVHQVLLVSVIDEHTWDDLVVLSEGET